MSARLAILRWAARIVRRERRQHVLLIGLVAAGVLAGVVVVTSLLRLDASANEDLRTRGDAAVAVRVDVFDQAAAATVDAGFDDERSPDAEVVRYRAAGDDGIEVVAQDPAAPMGSPWLDLAEGRWPDAPGETALTSRALDRLAAIGIGPLEIGDRVPVDGVDRTLVGRYDDPTRLDASRALVTAGDIGAWTHADILLPTPDTGTLDWLIALTATDGSGPAEGADAASAPLASGLTVGTSGQLVSNPTVPIAGYLIGTVIALEIAVLASAGFTVLANRRSRQLGVLAAVGATPDMVAWALLSIGLVVGVTGAFVGFAAGVLASIALTPALQHLVDHRLHATDLPWGFILPMVPLGVVTALAGAWWPARRLRSISAAAAISDRAGGDAGFVRGLVSGLALLGGGAVAVVVGAPKNAPLPIVVGVIAIVAGGLLLTPAAAALLGLAANRAPVPVRIAWRDLSRHRARSAGAIGAAAIALGLPFGIASFTASYSQTWQPSVPDHVAQIYGSAPDAGEVTPDPRPDPVTAAIAAEVPGATLVPVLMAGDTTVADDVGIGYSVRSHRGNDAYQQLRTAIATPALLDLMGIDPPGPGVDVIVTIGSDLDLDPSVRVERHLRPQPEGYPEALIVGTVPGAVVDRPLLDSWFLVNDAPFTTAERDRLEATSQRLGSWANLSEDPPPFVAVRSLAMLAGGLFGLAAVAAAVALIRIEASNESEVLTAVGASPATARGVGASTVLGLTLAAGCIGVTVALVTLVGVYLNPDEAFDFTIPWAELGAVFVLIPLAGAGAGWLLTSTRPRRISHTPLG